VNGARIRLACLWLSQTARVTADNCLRMFVILLVARAAPGASETAWHQVTPYFILPFILLAPINGALANSLQRRWVLAGASAWCLFLTVIVLLDLDTAPATVSVWCIALTANMLGAAVFSPARYALLPAAAEDARLPLPRVNGLIELGGAAGVAGGLLLGAGLDEVSWPAGNPAALAVILLLNLVAVLTALPVTFPSDVIRPEPPLRAVADFFRDAGRIWQQRAARASLLGLAGFMGLVVVGTGAILAYTDAFDPANGKTPLMAALVLVMVGAALGSFVAGLQGHPYRAIGLIPLGSIGLLVALVWALLGADPFWPSLLLGFMGGLLNVPLRAIYQAAVPADARGNAMAVSNTANYTLIVVLAAAMYTLVRFAGLTPTGQLVLLTVVTALTVLGLVWVLRRVALEQFMEVLVWPVYRFRAAGPGLDQVPLAGPVLVIANHTAYLDPLWVGKVLPRRIIPMMTSVFYDLPVIRQLMVYVVGTIRVQASGYRREAPELKEAIAALDRGECVVLFPEGRLRQDPKPSVRRFGRGVWHILNQRPQTPVVVLWIEGGWGSFFSYLNGPPMKRKRFDFWHQIGIAVSEPQVLDAETLADHQRTRTYLMRACLNARGYLGLEVPTMAEEKEDEEPAPLSDAAEKRA
jgi:1-acyl-sn-glycerol-3-phosphate acyltransferase